MTSNINYLSINENFPVAGQDNDTQVFRDNFDTIKTSLRNAQEEITDLQNDTAKLTETNDFGLNIIQKAVIQNSRDQKWNGGAPPASPITIDYEQGSYQIYIINHAATMEFQNLPGDPSLGETTPVGVGKITLELYSDGSSRILTFSSSSGTVIKKDSGFPAVLTLTSSTNPVFIEVWRHSQDTIFMRYLGQFA